LRALVRGQDERPEGLAHAPATPGPRVPGRSPARPGGAVRRPTLYSPAEPMRAGSSRVAIPRRKPFRAAKRSRTKVRSRPRPRRDRPAGGSAVRRRSPAARNGGDTSRRRRPSAPEARGARSRARRRPGMQRSDPSGRTSIALPARRTAAVLTSVSGGTT
jgi:hypothetical protein